MQARGVVPLPPMQAKRGAGRAARTPAERQEWTAHFKAQVQTRTPPDQARRERVRLARTHRRRHRRQKVLAPLRKLKLWKRAAETTPGKTEPTTKATTACIADPHFQRLEAQISAKRDQLSDKLRDAEAAARKRTMFASASSPAAAGRTTRRRPPLSPASWPARPATRRRAR